MSTAELEAALKALSWPQLREWVDNQLEGYSLPELDLEIEDSGGPYAKPGVPYHIPSGQVDAVMFQAQKQIERGYLVEVNYEHGMCPDAMWAFGKKKGRKWPGTD